MTQQILIAGAGGMVGSEVTRQLGTRGIPLSHADCDIVDINSIQKALDQWKPAAVFNCAAQPNVDQCESEPDRAYLVNGKAVGNLAKVCQASHIPLVHLSTDYLFDGSGTDPFTETHAPHPISVYGKSKLEGEEILRANCRDWIIARIQLIFGKGRHNFVLDAAKKLRSHVEVRAFSDQVGSPSYAADIAKIIIALFDGGHRGIFNVRNTGYASRVEVAEEIARQLNVTNPLITPVPLRDIKLPAARPHNCRLSIDKIQKLGIDPPSWQDAIKRYLHETQFL